MRDVAAEPCAELTLVIPNVRVLPTEHTAHVVVVSGQRLVVSSFVPVADRNRMVDALAASEQRYRALFEEDTDGRFVVTPDWHFIDCNGVLGRMLGFADGAAAVGHSLLDMTPDGPSLQKLLAVARVEGHAGPAELQVERADGTLIERRVRDQCVPEAMAVPIVSFRGKVTEITERKRLETRLQGAERMEAVGRLAGGLAHDFNNLLTVISGNSERLLDALPPHDPLTGAVTAIDEAASRAAAMTRQLLAYGRRQVFALEPVSLEHLVAAAQAACWPRSSAITSRSASMSPKRLPLISADPRQIEHVVANLARQRARGDALGRHAVASSSTRWKLARTPRAIARGSVPAATSGWSSPTAATAWIR